MNPENSKGYSRQAYEKIEKEIGDIAHSVDVSTPPEQVREKFAQQGELAVGKAGLYNEAWDQAIAEDTEHEEAAKLLEKMHENAGVRTGSEVESPIQEDALLPEHPVGQEGKAEMEKLYESLNLPHSKYGAEQLYSREFVGKERGLWNKLVQGLHGERWNNEERRKKFFTGSLMAGAAGTVGGIGGAFVAGAEGTALGLTAGQFILGGLLGVGGGALSIGVLGWAGLRAHHMLRERAHLKKFNKLAGLGKTLGGERTLDELRTH